ncbi:recombinase family protein [Knoellia sp. S7-12]|uniref:recombinase family protein n=1 Tax=Knoellia sp. S7-12 TaxID=3126698 RepID=UPI003368B633
MLIGYARVSTERQDLASQRAELRRLGVDDERDYTDKRTGKNKDRPGLREALAAAREGDALVVAKIDRLARSVPDARDMVQDLYEANGRLLGTKPKRASSQETQGRLRRWRLHPRGVGRGLSSVPGHDLQDPKAGTGGLTAGDRRSGGAAIDRSAVRVQAVSATPPLVILMVS